MKPMTCQTSTCPTRTIWEPVPRALEPKKKTAKMVANRAGALRRQRRRKWQRGYADDEDEEDEEDGDFERGPVGLGGYEGDGAAARGTQRILVEVAGEVCSRRVRTGGWGVAGVGQRPPDRLTPRRRHHRGGGTTAAGGVNRGEASGMGAERAVGGGADVSRC